MEIQSSKWIMGNNSHGHEYLLREMPLYIRDVNLKYFENQICKTRLNIRIVNNQSQVESPLHTLRYAPHVVLIGHSSTVNRKQKKLYAYACVASKIVHSRKDHPN